jgi:hypothetical protein
MAQIKLDGLEATDEIVYNYKVVNDIYLQTYNLEVDTFTNVQIELLSGIAHQCPFTGGNAVFQARGMLSLIDTLGYNDSLICGSGYAYRTTKNITTTIGNLVAFELKLYPNPANKEVIIKWSNLNCTTCKLYFYNSIGQKINEYILNKEEGIQTINTSSWQTGIYTSIINTADNKKIYKKLSIIK